MLSLQKGIINETIKCNRIEKKILSICNKDK